MQLLGNVLPGAVAIVLLAAGISKLVDSSGSFQSTLHTLGLSKSVFFVSIAVPVIEIVLAVSILLLPRSPVAIFGTAAAGGMFAVVGLYVLVRKLDASCSCFGSQKKKLGLRQLGYLPLWLASAVGLYQTSRSAITYELRFSVYWICLSLSVVSTRLLLVMRSAQATRKAIGWL